MEQVETMVLHNLGKARDPYQNRRTGTEPNRNRENTVRFLPRTEPEPNRLMLFRKDHEVVYLQAILY
ncbi:hypothetical protein BDB00DRAFT_800576 [Zychaea mexicana]|uniref:uncharacterized protein n=1 Tax=Zychaea mexicana TaxID=64656 RepID=UPI0022FF2287|nr:uncharacterized protein BDB00DRAFT_800576 [Zychaea mexicana]KAI9498504.1 hypothetical protein BDB00DRAFT_800576 [Zychaea mexicana]